MKVTSYNRRDRSRLGGRVGISLFIPLAKRLYRSKNAQIFDFLSIRAWVIPYIFIYIPNLLILSHLCLKHWYSDIYVYFVVFFVLFPFQPRFFRFKPCFFRLGIFSDCRFWKKPLLCTSSLMEWPTKRKQRPPFSFCSPTYLQGRPPPVRDRHPLWLQPCN